MHVWQLATSGTIQLNSMIQKIYYCIVYVYIALYLEGKDMQTKCFVALIMMDYSCAQNKQNSMMFSSVLMCIFLMTFHTRDIINNNRTFHKKETHFLLYGNGFKVKKWYKLNSTIYTLKFKKKPSNKQAGLGLMRNLEKKTENAER